MSPEIKEYTITLQPICTEQGSIRYGKALSAKELQQLCADQDVMTRLTANAMLELSAASVTASVQEAHDAYEALRIAELRQDERITAEEARLLEELRWYETKTPEEIVDFQLSVSQLCMPMKRFQEAAKAVFHHPLMAETLDDCRKTLPEERREMATEAALSEPGQETGPVMM